jgi:hypothetical protein
VATRIEDMTPPLLRLTPAPRMCPEASGPLRPAPRPTYADYLERQNAIDREVRRTTIPYSDYLRNLPPRQKPHAPAEPPAPRQPAPLAPGAPTLGLKLADIPPPQITRREIEVRTTYRVEVPLTSGRLIDVVM